MSRDDLEAIILKEWPTPNTYDPKFKIPPKSPGVYVIFARKKGVKFPDCLCPDLECIYVGSSSNLYQRYHGHPRMRDGRYWGHCFFFCEEQDYYRYEKLMIGILKPSLNIQHNG